MMSVWELGSSHSVEPTEIRSLSGGASVAGMLGCRCGTSSKRVRRSRRHRRRHHNGALCFRDARIPGPRRPNLLGDVALVAARRMSRRCLRPYRHHGEQKDAAQMALRQAQSEQQNHRAHAQDSCAVHWARLQEQMVATSRAVDWTSWTMHACVLCGMRAKACRATAR